MPKRRPIEEEEEQEEEEEEEVATPAKKRKMTASQQQSQQPSSASKKTASRNKNKTTADDNDEEEDGEEDVFAHNDDDGGAPASQRSSSSKRSQKKSVLGGARRLNRRARRGSDDESESDENGIGSATILEPQMRAKLVGDVVRYMLLIDSQKRVIRRPDIIEHVLGDEARVHFRSIIKDAAERCRETFGMEVVEMGNDGKFILVNRLKKPAFLMTTPAERAEYGLLMAIAGMIVITPDQCIEKSVLFDQLNRLGINQTAHRVFQSSDAIIKKFVSEM
jgi:hypothetical protein